MTPMMKQYHDIKAEHADALLLYRMGDFYELFGDDAIQAAPILDVALTRRPQSDGNDTPMCGVPAHAYEPYVARLIKAGLKVAICEQTESADQAKKRGSGALIKREVVRILTPGTLLEDGLLPLRQSNYLAVVSPIQKGKVGIAILELSVGEFCCENANAEDMWHALERWNPAEIVCPDEPNVLALMQHTLDRNNRLSKLPLPRFDAKNATDRLMNFYKVATMESFGDFSPLALQAAGVALDYIYLTQKQLHPHIRPIRGMHDHVFMDASTRRHLELTHSVHGTYEGSLLSVIDFTHTACGARQLRGWVQSPERDLATINARYDRLDALRHMPHILSALRETLQGCPDIERALTRIHCERAGPRDLGVILHALKRMKAIDELAMQNASPVWQGLTIRDESGTEELLQRALSDTLPLHARDGGFIAPQFCEELDRLRHMRDTSAEMIQALQTRYAQETGINTLKIKHNNVWGYFVEVSAVHQEKMPYHFIHRQTLASAMRFSTAELMEMEKEITSAKDQALARELALFEELSKHIRAQNFGPIVQALTLLDAWASLAYLAQQKGYTRPILDDTTTLHIKGGRHPVVEAYISTPFTPNDSCFQPNETLCLLTGPNMAGKSTYLRQNAIVVLMAHMGSFVPAEKAHIGRVDRIFSRIGASDDLAGGRSTFMVEMLETATILNQATAQSLVILDELGRGTSTHDGLALAWAVVEDLHNRITCRTLFATHYHELQVLQLKGMQRSTLRVDVSESGAVTFFHEVIPGEAKGSYGLYVAEKAGVPASVLERAHAILHRLETAAMQPKQAKLPMAAPTPAMHPILSELKGLQTDAMTPLEALQWLTQAKMRVQK